MKYFKAFKKGMTCNRKQYQENTVYEEAGGSICGSGMMHFCETPFDTLDYYPLVDTNGDFSEFAEVEPLDEIVVKDNKRACKKIRIGEKLSFKDFIKAGVDILIEKTKPEKAIKDVNLTDLTDLNDNGERKAKIGSSGNEAKIGSSGTEAKIGSSGYRARIGSSGYMAKIGSSGDKVQIGSSGNGAQIGSSGNWAKIGSSGDEAQIGSSGDWAQIGSSGDWAQIGSSGNRAQIGSSGDWARIKMEGKRSVAAAVGCNCAISGKRGDWITLAEWKMDADRLYPVCVRSAQIDGEILKEDVMYKLEDGEFKEVDER